MFIVKPPDDERNLRPRPRFGDPRFEPSDWHKVMAIQNLHVLGRFFVVNRYPQLHALFWIGKPRWHNANNCVGLCVHTYRVVQDRRVAAEASLPQSPAQDSCRICRWLVIRRGEASSERGFDPECWQQIRGKLDGAHSSGNCPPAPDRLYSPEVETIAKSEKLWLCLFHSANMPAATWLYG